MSAESVGLGMNLVSHLLRNNFKGYIYGFMHRSLPVYFLTSLRHVQINYNYPLMCFIVTHKDITERFIFSPFSFWIALLTCSMGQYSLLYRKFRDPDKML